MYYPLNIKKAIAAASVLLSEEEHGCMEYMRLLKLLYIADRESLKESEAPILGIRVVAMKKGPLHSRIYQLIKGEDPCSNEWSKFFTTHGFSIHLDGDRLIGPLSRFEIKKLKEVFHRYSEFDTFDVIDETHRFKEWKKNYPDPKENTSRQIEFEDIVAAIGREDDLDHLAGIMKESYRLDKVLPAK